MVNVPVASKLKNVKVDAMASDPRGTELSTNVTTFIPSWPTVPTGVAPIYEKDTAAVGTFCHV